ncbi:uncharacterized protein LOC120168172 [Hibiscus syriacus]|uniref:uncharacterized protein LOC120168172 n=1 Tax=Hibiscus syriacus TaxID=106335 RepID=UPI001920C791|nr:uncharacterized protein LOC120168172 [Hibiscus syriacus]
MPISGGSRVSGDNMFTNKCVSVTLDESNCMLWNSIYSLSCAIIGWKKLLNGSVPSPCSTVTLDDERVVDNDAYEVFFAQGSALASWLLSTIDPFLSHLVGVETTIEIWSKVIQFFANKSSSTIVNLHYKLKLIRKGDLSMHTYIAQVNEICDAFSTCDAPVSDYEQIVTILNGAPVPLVM